ncbi:MAG: mycofactocin biosynthesis chaperone MftB [Deltaproteobacteria bacterium]|nr:mycofactocin biosynthesis chaperone MftB [Candidatus Anaeroferrophillacea bacterium]
MNNARYLLAPGTQVREEDFGLLFYTMKGPRLYFIASGDLLDGSFFQGRHTLPEWARQKAGADPSSARRMEKVTGALCTLREKGVIREC